VNLVARFSHPTSSVLILKPFDEGLKREGLRAYFFKNYVLLFNYLKSNNEWLLKLSFFEHKNQKKNPLRPYDGCVLGGLLIINY